MGKTILIVDDAAAIRQVVKIALSQSGYNVVEAENGKMALDKLQGNQIDLIISDLNMPEMNGIELLQHVKQEAAYEAYKFTPVIMLTTESGEDKVEKGRELGARAWVVKPFKPDELLSAVKKIIM